jgi:hypothetical protein
MILSLYVFDEFLKKSSSRMPKRIGSIHARITELAYPYYRVDFTRHNNVWDSDDEENDCQWSYSIRFAYENVKGAMLFRNLDEIPYDTTERYTARVFWQTHSTTIMRMIQDTFAVRRARGDPLPPWSLSAICHAAEKEWDERY